MRQIAPQSSDRPPRGASRASKSTTTRGANGGLAILISEDGSKSAISGAVVDERSQSGRHPGPRRSSPR
ncbi:MAG: hypothetical protein IT372_32895 [Polyangiaceae bacterium]|nr:hypothetical protein [Polyangiaceae bacterium]